jgi:alkanesulfonate monooxygenase SsuD/methylene tetrahydromethanopterin reductase-like flavin-dependent oxidoreductase (luciferase family)
MRLSIFLDPQEGMTFRTMLEAARATERGGFHGLYRSDHLASTSGRFERAATEAWTTLAALAMETSRIRLGTLITPLTFREPSLLSKTVSTVAEISGDRVDVSIGTGWNAGEHERLGLGFPAMGERFDRLEEYLRILSGFWGDDPLEFEGRYYRAGGILPRPLPSPRPPLIIGGHGRRRTPRLAARYADEYNIDWPSVAQAGAFYAFADEACAEIGRDPATLRRSVLLGVIVGEDQADLRRIIGPAIRELGGTDPDEWLEAHQDSWRAGTPGGIEAWLRQYEAIGTDHVMLMCAPSTELRMIDTLARTVLPALDPEARSRG